MTLINRIAFLAGSILLFGTTAMCADPKAPPVPSKLNQDALDSLALAKEGFDCLDAAKTHAAQVECAPKFKAARRVGLRVGAVSGTDRLAVAFRTKYLEGLSNIAHGLEVGSDHYFQLGFEQTTDFYNLLTEVAEQNNPSGAKKPTPLPLRTEEEVIMELYQSMDACREALEAILSDQTPRKAFYLERLRKAKKHADAILPYIEHSKDESLLAFRRKYHVGVSQLIDAIEAEDQTAMKAASTKITEFYLVARERDGLPIKIGKE